MAHSQIRVRGIVALAALLFSSVLGNGFLSAPTVTSPPPEDSRLSPRLLQVMEEAGADQSVPVVVMTGRPILDSEEAEARAAGAQLSRRFGKLSGYAAQVPAGALRRLAAIRGVLGVSYDSEVAGANDLNYVTVGADLAAREYSGSNPGLDGSGVTIAVVDSGVAAHPDLGSRLVAEVEIVGHEKGFADPYGHGTHVAGIIAGDGAASSDPKSFRRFNGIAPKARIVSVRVLDAKGGGRVSDVLSGIDWVLEHQDEYGIRILNLSLGHPVEEPSITDPLCRAVEAAWGAGILVVIAAGNAGGEGYASIHSPGNDATILTVGASNNFQSGSRSDDILTTYTSRGPTSFDHVVKPDLVAPGNRTLSLRAVGSTLDEAYPSLRVKQGLFRDDPASAGEDSLYFQMSGSSMAAGVVSGMAALMIQADPSLTPDTLKARLMKSAEKRPVYDVFSEGAGFADLHAALAEEGTALSGAPSPTVEWTEAGLAIETTGARWLSSDACDPATVYGPEPLRGTGGVWADSDIWSDSSSERSATILSGHSIVWGGGKKSSDPTGGSSSTSSDSIVWGGGRKDSTTTSGASTVGADSIVWGGGRKDSSTITGSSTVSADSIVWGGGRKTTTDVTLVGDATP
jgi:serine protease AprX